MADNTQLSTNVGSGDVVRTEDRAGVKTQIVGLDLNPAGSEVLGTGDATNGLDVDVTRVQGTVTTSATIAAALPAGNNNIGDVDVVTAPGQVATGGALPGVVSVVAGYDGANVRVMKTSAAGIQQVDGSAVTQPVSDGAGSLTVDAPVATPVFVRLSDGAAAITTLPVSGNVGYAPRTSGGYTISRTICGASTNATSVKGSAGQLYGWFISNTAATPAYLKLYNTAGTPTAGAGTPVMTILIPGNTAGAGAVQEFMGGIAFGTGIGFTVTGAVTDADTTALAANTCVINLFYS